MKQQSKFSPASQHNETQHSHAPAGREFAGAEELLRLDAAQTAVPPRVGERLKHSAAGIVPPKSGWIKRLFN